MKEPRDRGEIPNELLAEMQLARQTSPEEIAFILRESESIGRWDKVERRSSERRVK